MKFTRILLLSLAILPVSFSVYGGDTVRSTLPLIIIHTNGQEIPDEPKIPVNMGIITGTSNSPADPFNDYNGLAGIEIRGSSSQMFDKKGYGFETWSQPGADTSVSLMGLPAENDWVLHGPYSDKSLIRNALTYHLAGSMGHYAPRARLCELYINDNYRGVYLLVEKIKRDKNRVNIAKLTEKDTAGPALTGGYIVKLDKSTGSANNLSFTSNFWPYVGSDLPDFMVDYPDGNSILPVQMNYIRHHINDFETVLHGANFKDPVNGYRAYIDVPSFIDYFIINELSKNVDGFRLSSYIYKDRDDRDPKLYAGPVWDYDLAFGNADYSDAWEVSGWQYETDGGAAPVPFWWERLLQDKYFAGKLKCRWEELRRGLLSSESIVSVVDSLVNTVGKAADRNFKKYPILGIYVWPNYYIGYDYRSEVYYLENWILDRMNYMDHFLPGACLPTSLDENNEATFKAVVFPNPSSGNIHLGISNPAQKELQLTVYDMKGSPVAFRSFEKNTEITCDIPASPGIYEVILTDGKHIVPVKAVVQ